MKRTSSKIEEKKKKKKIDFVIVKFQNEQKENHICRSMTKKKDQKKERIEIKMM